MEYKASCYCALTNNPCMFFTFTDTLSLEFPSILYTILSVLTTYKIFYSFFQNYYTENKNSG